MGEGKREEERREEGKGWGRAGERGSKESPAVSGDNGHKGAERCEYCH